jgi:hypothetical protein
MNAKTGDVVRIACRHSKYNGVVGVVFEIQPATEYAIVDMPKSTEERIERIHQNTILQQMEQSEKLRKSPSNRRWPKGDPQWFPLRWLSAEPAEPSLLELEAAEVEV